MYVYSYSINTNTVSGDQADQAQRCAGSQGRLDPANGEFKIQSMKDACILTVFTFT